MIRSLSTNGLPLKLTSGMNLMPKLERMHYPNCPRRFRISTVFSCESEFEHSESDVHSTKCPAARRRLREFSPYSINLRLRFYTCRLHHAIGIRNSSCSPRPLLLGFQFRSQNSNCVSAQNLEGHRDHSDATVPRTGLTCSTVTETNGPGLVPTTDKYSMTSIPASSLYSVIVWAKKI